LLSFTVTLAGLKNIVRYTRKEVPRGSLYPDSTVQQEKKITNETNVPLKLVRRLFRTRFYIIIILGSHKR